MPRPATIKQRTPKVDTSRRGMAFASQDLTRAEGLSGYDVVARPVATVAADTSAASMQANKLASYARALGSVNPAIDAVGKAWMTRNQVKISDYETRINRGETLSDAEMEDWKAQIATDRISAQDSLANYRADLLAAIAESQGDMEKFRGLADTLDVKYRAGKSTAYLNEFSEQAQRHQAEALQHVQSQFLQNVHDEHAGKAFNSLHEEYTTLLGGVLGLDSLDAATSTVGGYADFERQFDEAQDKITERLQGFLNHLKETNSQVLSKDDVNAQFYKVLEDIALSYGVLPKGIGDIKGPGGLKLSQTKIGPQLVDLRFKADEQRERLRASIMKSNLEARKEDLRLRRINLQNDIVKPVPPDDKAQAAHTANLMRQLVDLEKNYPLTPEQSIGYRKVINAVTSNVGFAPNADYENDALKAELFTKVANRSIKSITDKPIVDALSNASLTAESYRSLITLIGNAAEANGGSNGDKIRQMCATEFKPTILGDRFPKGNEFLDLNAMFRPSQLAAYEAFVVEALVRYGNSWDKMDTAMQMAALQKIRDEKMEELDKRTNIGAYSAGTPESAIKTMWLGSALMKNINKIGNGQDKLPQIGSVKATDLTKSPDSTLSPADVFKRGLEGLSPDERKAELIKMLQHANELED